MKWGIEKSLFSPYPKWGMVQLCGRKGWEISELRHRTGQVRTASIDAANKYRNTHHVALTALRAVKATWRSSVHMGKEMKYKTMKE